MGHYKNHCTPTTEDSVSSQTTLTPVHHATNVCPRPWVTCELLSTHTHTDTHAKPSFPFLSGTCLSISNKHQLPRTFPPPTRYRLVSRTFPWTPCKVSGDKIYGTLPLPFPVVNRTGLVPISPLGKGIPVTVHSMPRSGKRLTCRDIYQCPIKDIYQ